MYPSYVYPSYVQTNPYGVYADQRQIGQWLPFLLPGLIPGTQPPFQPPGQGQGTGGAPSTPPPSFTPSQSPQLFAVDPGSIRGCLFRFTYIWLQNRQQFWFYPTFVGPTSVAGFRWTGFNWVFFGIDLRQIQSFTCF